MLWLYLVLYNTIILNKPLYWTKNKMVFLSTTYKHAQNMRKACMVIKIDSLFYGMLTFPDVLQRSKKKELEVKYIFGEYAPSIYSWHFYILQLTSFYNQTNTTPRNIWVLVILSEILPDTLILINVILRMQFSPCILSMNKTLDYLCNLVMDCNLWCNFKMTIPVGQFSGWRFPILVKYIDNKSQVIKWWELKFTLLNYWWWGI